MSRMPSLNRYAEWVAITSLKVYRAKKSRATTCLDHKNRSPVRRGVSVTRLRALLSAVDQIADRSARNMRYGPASSQGIPVRGTISYTTKHLSGV